MSTQVRTIVVKLDERVSPGAAKISQSLSTINKDIKSVASSTNMLSTAFGGLVAYMSFSTFTQAADQFQLLRDRIYAFTGSAELAADTFEKLRVLAPSLRTSVQSVGEAYNRVAMSASDLGLTQNQLLGTVQALMQTFRLSGSTIAESTAATIQFTQGLASGQLRGQEMRSVLEANATLGGILAKSLGIGRGQLLKYAEAGSFTSDVVLKALAKSFKDLNSQASKLGVTFDQSMTMGVDRLRGKVDELNQKLELNKKFFAAVNFAVDNLDGIVIALAISTLPKLATALKMFSMSNPYMAGLTILGAVLPTIIDKVNKFSEETGGTASGVAIAEKSISMLNAELVELRKNASASDFPREAEKIYKRIQFTRDLYRIDPLKNVPEKSKDLLGGIAKGMEDLEEKGLGLKTTLSQISLMNPFLIPTQATAEYNYNLRIATDLTKDLGIANTDLEYSFISGKKSVEDFRTELEKTQEVSTAKASMFEASKKYLDSLGTWSSGFADTIGNSFKNLEDGIYNTMKGIEKGKFTFKSFTQSILDDLLRVATRMTIMQPIVNSVMGMLGGGYSSPLTQPTLQYSAPSAPNFNMGNGNYQFASGGVVDSPTLFKFAKGTGLMGEAGSEAILPLKRNSKGDLGVQASTGNSTVVNVINNSGSEATVKETTNSDGIKQIDVMIASTVLDNINKGKFDSAFSRNYGINRKGV